MNADRRSATVRNCLIRAHATAQARRFEDTTPADEPNAQTLLWLARLTWLLYIAALAAAIAEAYPS